MLATDAERVDGPMRILIIWSDQARRVALAAELSALGYEIAGARDSSEALALHATEHEREAVRLLIVEQEDMHAELEAELFRRVRGWVGNPPVLLLAHATREPPPGEWGASLRRPFALGDVVRAVCELLSLPREEPARLEP